MTGNEIRKRFLAYFEKHHHRIVRSSSLVPHDDPTLLFTNAGMVQFKRTFIGEERRDYQRAATSQKCVRAGGKHNDLENVGYTARHHTFFEMLGNFSFGDYFKEKAIECAWDLLTNGFGLPPEKLWVSVYQEDDDAYNLWQRGIGIPQERMARLGKKDNFWAMGDTGPCGPCSEIHLDRGAALGCGKPDCSLGCECDRFLEIWNLVFMQYEQNNQGELHPLPSPSIDTGMGLERLAAVLQNTPTNFETDLLRPIIARTEELSGKRYGDGTDTDTAMKVIADHSRAAAFLIGDGILPSNEGRGYVLRRIMRRAIRYGRNIGLERPFLYRTAETVFDIMKPAYPELAEASAFIGQVIQSEELRFMETLDIGLRLLNDSLAELREQNRTEIPGDLIFKLYDTFGFPVDIVRDVVRDSGMGIDTSGFEAHMEAQRARSRSKVAFDNIADAYRSLSSQAVRPEFHGYQTLSLSSNVLLLVQDGHEVPEVHAGQSVEVVTAQTPFYGEAGGQVGDQGTISGPDMTLTVENTIKDPTGLIIHRGKVVSGRIAKDQTVTLTVDGAKRAATALNHTATHLLHAALRKVLGDHVKQAGSLVSAQRLRFDFTHFAQVPAEQLAEIEAIVNAQIRANVAVHTDEMDADEAMRSGAMALFEEKYGDRVRVVSLSEFSRELCGGTHTRRTGDIGLFTIIAETSVASGVRRIEGLTGAAAFAHARQAGQLVQQLAHLLRAKPDELIDRVQHLLNSHRAIEKEVEKFKSALADAKAQSETDETRLVKGVNVLIKQVSVDTPAALRDLADRFRDRMNSGIVVLGSVAEGKVLLIVIVSQDLVKRFHAGRIVKDLSAMVGGGGGGRPDMAQAGGTQPENLPAALEKAYAVIEEMAG